jgi:hypothetical protein
MKIVSSLIGWLLVISLLLLSFTFVDFLALHDIHQDYVSTYVLEYLQINISDELPGWTSTELEWGWIRISLLLKTILIVVIIISLVKVAKKLKLLNKIYPTKEAQL